MLWQSANIASAVFCFVDTEIFGCPAHSHVANGMLLGHEPHRFVCFVQISFRAHESDERIYHHQTRKQLWSASAWDRFLWASRESKTLSASQKMLGSFLKYPQSHFQRSFLRIVVTEYEKVRSLDDMLL